MGIEVQAGIDGIANTTWSSSEVTIVPSSRTKSFLVEFESKFM